MSIRLLFLQSQSFFGADSAIHAQLMRHFDPGAVEIHVACTTEETANPATSAIRHIRTIPDVQFRPTHFGPSIHGAGRSAMPKRILGSLGAAGNLLSLGAYIRRHRIQVLHGTEKPRDAFYGVLLGKLTGAKSIIHMHVAYDKWLTRKVKWALGQA